MNVKSESDGGVLDTVKLILAGAILIGGIAAYYFYADQSILLRVGGVILAAVLAVAVAMQTTQGRTFWHFATGSRVELRKVVWPTREETLQTTIAVIIFAMILGVFFWLLDMVLAWGARSLTGHGG